jgi:hypothetical protein
MAANAELAIIKLRNAATVDEHTRQYGLGWFDITLLEQVAGTFRASGPSKNTLAGQRLLTNDLVRAL